MSLSLQTGLGLGPKNIIPRKKLVFLTDNRMIDTIGLSVSDYDSVDPSVRDVFFINSTTLRATADAITLAYASPWLSVGETMVGDETKGIVALYKKDTAESVLSRAHRYINRGFVKKLFKITVKTNNSGTTNSTSVGLPLSGSFEIEWGDGIVEVVSGAVSSTPTVHDYGVSGTYAVRVTPDITDIGALVDYDRYKVTQVANLGCTSITSYKDVFKTYSKLTDFTFGNCDFSDVVSIQGMFATDVVLASVNFLGIDTSNVTNMAYLMYECELLTDLDLSPVNISSLTDISFAFASSGLTEESYSKILIGFANKVHSGAGLAGVNMSGQTGMTYSATVYGGTPFDNAVDARNYLVTATGSSGAGWTITNDTQV